MKILFLWHLFICSGGGGRGGTNNSLRTLHASATANTQHKGEEEKNSSFTTNALSYNNTVLLGNNNKSESRSQRGQGMDQRFPFDEFAKYKKENNTSFLHTDDADDRLLASKIFNHAQTQKVLTRLQSSRDLDLAQHVLAEKTTHPAKINVSAGGLMDDFNFKWLFLTLDW